MSSAPQTIQPAAVTACYGTCCPHRGHCAHYLAVEKRPEWAPVIDTCIDGGGRHPLFSVAPDGAASHPSISTPGDRQP